MSRVIALSPRLKESCTQSCTQTHILACFVHLAWLVAWLSCLPCRIWCFGRERLFCLKEAFPPQGISSTSSQLSTINTRTIDPCCFQKEAPPPPPCNCCYGCARAPGSAIVEQAGGGGGGVVGRTSHCPTSNMAHMAFNDWGQKAVGRARYQQAG
jgi:hypothetical protein